MPIFAPPAVLPPPPAQARAFFVSSPPAAPPAERAADAFRKQARADGYGGAAPLHPLEPLPAPPAPAPLPGFSPPPPPAPGSLDSFLFTLRAGLPLRLAHAAYGAGAGALAPATVVLDAADAEQPALRWEAAGGAGACRLPFAAIRGVQEGALSTLAAIVPADRDRLCLTVAVDGPLTPQPRGAAAPAPAPAPAAAAAAAATTLLLIECEDADEASFIAACLWAIAREPAAVGRSIELFAQRDRLAAQG